MRGSRGKAADEVEYLAHERGNEQASREAEEARAIHASPFAARDADDRPGARASKTARAHTTAAPSKAKRKAGRKPSSAARAPKSHDALCTPATIPMVRERKAKPPAAPCWRGGNDAMISARLGTWNVPIPKPTRARAAPTRGSVVEAPQRPTRNSPAASAVSPISIGPHGPQRSVARPASGAARAVATGVSMKRSPPAVGPRPRPLTREYGARSHTENWAKLARKPRSTAWSTGQRRISPGSIMRHVPRGVACGVDVHPARTMKAAAIGMRNRKTPRQPNAATSAPPISGLTLSPSPRPALAQPSPQP